MFWMIRKVGKFQRIRVDIEERASVAAPVSKLRRLVEFTLSWSLFLCFTNGPT
jgi:hypothetical protein